MNALLSPLGLGLLLALLLVLVWRRSPRVVRVLGLVFGLLLLFSLAPIGANALVYLIESRVPAAADCAAPLPDTIVVLSAGLQREPRDADDVTALRSESVTRALAGILLWRQSPGATLAFAGGGPFATKESAILQRFAETLGVPTSSMRREEQSQTTWESAQGLRALAPALSKRIWLVSSALHLPRALVAFRAHGFDACGYPSERRYLPPGGVGYYVPQSSALLKTEEALHELLGEAWYRWRGAP